MTKTKLMLASLVAASLAVSGLSLAAKTTMKTFAPVRWTASSGAAASYTNNSISSLTVQIANDAVLVSGASGAAVLVNGCTSSPFTINPGSAATCSLPQEGSIVVTTNGTQNGSSGSFSIPG